MERRVERRHLGETRGGSAERLHDGDLGGEVVRIEGAETPELREDIARDELGAVIACSTVNDAMPCSRSPGEPVVGFEAREHRIERRGVVGYIDGIHFLGGRPRIDRERASREPNAGDRDGKELRSQRCGSAFRMRGERSAVPDAEHRNFETR